MGQHHKWIAPEINDYNTDCLIYSVKRIYYLYRESKVSSYLTDNSRYTKGLISKEKCYCIFKNFKYY